MQLHVRDGSPGFLQILAVGTRQTSELSEFSFLGRFRNTQLQRHVLHLEDLNFDSETDNLEFFEKRMQ